MGYQRASFIGISSGAATVLEMAARQPSKVDAIVAASAYAHVDLLLRLKLGSWLAALKYGGNELKSTVATPWVWGARFLQDSPEILIKIQERINELPVEPACNLIMGAMDYDIRPILRDITAKTLVIAGEQDLLTPLWGAQELVSMIPNASIQIIPGTGHMCAFERPQEFSRSIPSLV